ncbi:MAG: hypothetical protein COB96_07320 [Planctomycetota bacterium]|nr:MAG: hypothetical protein COB96_07320 [Planctomycetota bacterium]
MRRTLRVKFAQVPVFLWQMLLAAALLYLQETIPDPPLPTETLQNTSSVVPLPEDVSPVRLRNTLRNLCREPRLAGSKESKLAIDYVTTVFQEAGLRVERQRYLCYLPRQIDASLWLLDQGERQQLDLEERGYPEDPDSIRNQVAPMHGLTQPGHVRGRVVFAGRGLVSDFEELRKSGVNPAGTIALIRYGGLYRGLKVKNAADAGCVGALLYTDSDDDGKAKGEVLPNGPWRPHDGIQRGSVFNGNGDALTPGVAALADAERISLNAATGLVTIPSIPISMVNATLLFGTDGRPERPGQLASRIEMQVEQDPAPVWIENVIGWIDAEDPDAEWVVAGAHRDAWGFGAVDNGTGTAVLLETARVLGAAAAAGWRPQRSIALATWDGEEWGLVGSNEWVEQHRDDLMARAVAYLNMDVVASGPNFGASCTPGLVAVLNQACADEQIEAPANLGVPGGGSDHVPFLEIAGVEVSSFGFHGGSGAYHSAYDTPYLIEKYLDPEFQHHAAAGRMLVRMLTNLASKSTRVDGIRGWANRAGQEASKLELPADLARRLAAAIQELEALAATTTADHPHRFLRLFIPAARSERLILWRTAGYGAAWFPEIKNALAAGKNPAAATSSVIRALNRGAALLRGSQ